MQKREYVEGYNHYDKHRTIPETFYLNEAEENFLSDLLAVLHVRNKSEFMRNQVFHAYQGLTEEQRQQMAEVARWRATEDNKTPPLR